MHIRIAAHLLQRVTNYEMQIAGGNIPSSMPSAEGAKKPTAKPARPAVEAHAAESLALPPLKKPKREAKVLEPSGTFGNLAMEDDFFLEADTAGISEAPPMTLLVSVSRQGHVARSMYCNTSRPSSVFKTKQNCLHLSASPLEQEKRHVSADWLSCSLQ